MRATRSCASAIIRRSSSGAAATKAFPSQSSMKDSIELIYVRWTARATTRPVRIASTCRTAARTSIMDPQALLHHPQSRLLGRNRHAFDVRRWNRCGAGFPKEDQWPISDDWAYHDWHQSGNGDMAPFMARWKRSSALPLVWKTSSARRRCSNYVEHRAIFEGMNAHLWSPNSGRLLWMTQPAWPSTTWQILSSDYDTQRRSMA